MISSEILELCAQLELVAQPEFVDVELGLSGEAGRCYYDVRERVEQAGGTQLFGWLIWEWPEQFIEAEHHSIWRAPNGLKLDVSKKLDGEETVLFVEDTSKEFDFEHPKRWSNRRQALNPSDAVKAFLMASNEHDRFIARNVVSVGEGWGIPEGNAKFDRRLRRLNRAKLEALGSFKRSLE